MKKRILFGMDIGGTNTVYGLVDENAKLIAHSGFKTNTKPEINAYVKIIAEQLSAMYNKYSNEYELAGIGIGAPNGNYYTGSIKLPPNIPWIKDLNLVQELKKYFDVPIVLTNDANAMAYGEMIFGAAQGAKDIIVITLGTGLGSGIIVNGKVVYGHEGIAGELGHVCVVPNGRHCACGKDGCLETYASASGIKRTLFQLIAEHDGKSVFNTITFEQLTSKMIAEAALQGDPIALEAFEYTGNLLGLALANAALVTQPEVVVLSGGLAKAGDLIFKPTIKTFEKYLLPLYRDKIKVIPSTLKNDSAAIMGAAALVWNEMDNN
jgi:glucokinase